MVARFHSIVCMIYSRLHAPPCADKEPEPGSGAEKPAESCSQGRRRSGDPVLSVARLPPRAVRCDHQLPVEGKEAGRNPVSPPLPLSHDTKHRPSRPSSTTEGGLRQHSTDKSLQAALSYCSRAVDHHSSWCFSPIA